MGIKANNHTHFGKWPNTYYTFLRATFSHETIRQNMKWWTIRSHDLICYHQNVLVKWSARLKKLPSWKESTRRKKIVRCITIMKEEVKIWPLLKQRIMLVWSIKCWYFKPTTRDILLVVACLNWTLKCASWDFEYNS